MSTVFKPALHAVLFMCGAFAAPCFAQQRPADSAARARDIDERAVQSAAIDTLVASSHIKVVLLMHTTEPLNVGSAIPHGMPRAAWPDFMREAPIGRTIRPLATRSAVQFTTMSHASRPMRAPVTDTSVVTLSAVGFSPSRNVAIVYMDQSCGSRCGSTSLQAFRRQGDRWILIARHVESVR